MGSFGPEQLRDVLSRIDLLVVPSLWFENSPLTIHEAAAAGIPVLASNHGGLAEYVTPEVNGRLFEPGNAADLREKILSFLTKPLSVRRNAIPIKDIAEDASAMEAHYRSVLTRTELHRS
jgi:glycosyltransferase involved in cell wall biosynthesis